MVNVNKIESVQKIKEALIKACIKSRPSYFKPYLLSGKVINEWPDNESFYKFFKLMISNSRKMSDGEIHLRVESKDENKSLFNFYDSIHVYPRLTVVVLELNGNLHINVLPF
jgi:hypothetical protein